MDQLTGAGRAIEALSQRLLYASEATEGTVLDQIKEFKHVDSKTALVRLLKVTSAECHEVIPLVDVADFCDIESRPDVNADIPSIDAHKHLTVESTSDVKPIFAYRPESTSTVWQTLLVPVWNRVNQFVWDVLLP